MVCGPYGDVRKPYYYWYCYMLGDRNEVLESQICFIPIIIPLNNGKFLSVILGFTQP